MESVSDTYAGNAGVRSIAANYKKIQTFSLMNLFWIYCAVITIFYILMHSVEYEKIKLGYVQSNISNQWKGDRCFKIYLWFWDRDNREYLSFCRKYDLPEDDSGQNQYLLYWSCCKAIWINGTLDMIFVFPILCRYGYDEGGYLQR